MDIPPCTRSYGGDNLLQSNDDDGEHDVKNVAEMTDEEDDDIVVRVDLDQKPCFSS